MFVYVLMYMPVDVQVKWKFNGAGERGEFASQRVDESR